MKIWFFLILFFTGLHTEIDFVSVSDETVLTLYQMIKDIHEIFEENDIHYWMHAGTLLGAIRHGGLIPWDDDIDIIIDKSEEERFISLISVLDFFGYEVCGPFSFGYKIFPKSLTRSALDCWPDRSPWIDVMIFVNVDDKYIYNCLHEAGETEGYFAKIFFGKSDLFPLRKYRFGNIFLYGPNNPFPYLDLVYPEWDQYAIVYNHVMNKPDKVFLACNELVPLLPKQPLEDKF